MDTSTTSSEAFLRSGEGCLEGCLEGVRENRGDAGSEGIGVMENLFRVGSKVPKYIAIPVVQLISRGNCSWMQTKSFGANRLYTRSLLSKREEARRGMSVCSAFPLIPDISSYKEMKPGES